MNECGNCKYYSMRPMSLVPTGICTNKESVLTVVPCYASCEHFEDKFEKKEDGEEDKMLWDDEDRRESGLIAED